MLTIRQQNNNLKTIKRITLNKHKTSEAETDSSFLLIKYLIFVFQIHCHEIRKLFFTSNFSCH